MTMDQPSGTFVARFWRTAAVVLGAALALLLLRLNSVALSEDVLVLDLNTDSVYEVLLAPPINNLQRWRVLRGVGAAERWAIDRVSAPVHLEERRAAWEAALAAIEADPEAALAEDLRAIHEADDAFDDEGSWLSDGVLVERDGAEGDVAWLRSRLDAFGIDVGSDDLEPVRLLFLQRYWDPERLYPDEGVVRDLPRAIAIRGRANHFLRQKGLAPGW